VADPATRTYTVKVAIPASPDVRLGMTAVVLLSRKSGDAHVHVPLSALVRDRGATGLWVVDKGVVHLMPVQVAGVDGNDVLVAGGIQPGQTVVTAGVHLLKEGQKVRILAADVARRGDAEAAAAGAAQ
jgi:multidrug efflux system membrane fusion protein